MTCPSQIFDSLSQQTTTCGLELGHTGLHDDGCLSWRDPYTPEEIRENLQQALVKQAERAKNDGVTLDELTRLFNGAVSEVYP